MNKNTKKQISKEAFVQIMTTKTDKKAHVNKDKRYWNDFEEKNATKNKFRW